MDIFSNLLSTPIATGVQTAISSRFQNPAIQNVEDAALQDVADNINYILQEAWIFIFGLENVFTSFFECV